MAQLPHLEVRYDYDAFGRITMVQDSNENGDRQDHSYDGEGRLVSAQSLYAKEIFAVGYSGYSVHFERDRLGKRVLLVLVALMWAGAWSESWAGDVDRAAVADSTGVQAKDRCIDIWAGLSKSCMAMLDQRHLDEDVRYTRPPKAAVRPGRLDSSKWSPLPNVDRIVWRDVFRDPLALRNAVAEAADQPRCQAMRGEAAHWLRSSCSADAFARLSVLHRTCGEMLHRDSMERDELWQGWAADWEWKHQALKEEAEAQNHAQRAAGLRERELAFAWRLAKCRQVPKEALRPIEMIRPPHFLGNMGSNQYDQGYLLLHVAARLRSIWANTQAVVAARQVNAMAEVNLPLAYLQQASYAAVAHHLQIPTTMQLPLLLVAREHDLRGSEAQVDWSELSQEFSPEEIDAASPLVERLLGMGWRPLPERAEEDPTWPWTIAPPVVERRFIARRYDDEGNVRWVDPSGWESWFGKDGTIHQADPAGKWSMVGNPQIATAGVTARRWTDIGGKKRWADKLGHEHWLDEEGAEHWIDWGGTEWILLPVGVPLPKDVE